MPAIKTSRDQTIKKLALQHGISHSTAYRRLVEQNGSDFRLASPGRPKALDYMSLDWTQKDEVLATENSVSVASINTHRKGCVHGFNRWQVRAMQIDAIINAGSQSQPQQS